MNISAKTAVRISAMIGSPAPITPATARTSPATPTAPETPAATTSR